MTASGTFGYGEEYFRICRFEQTGSDCSQRLSITPKQGNPVPRIVETPSGMLNAIGLQNIGVAAFHKGQAAFLAANLILLSSRTFSGQRRGIYPGG